MSSAGSKSTNREKVRKQAGLALAYLDSSRVRRERNLTSSGLRSCKPLTVVPSSRPSASSASVVPCVCVRHRSPLQHEATHLDEPFPVDAEPAAAVPTAVPLAACCMQLQRCVSFYSMLGLGWRRCQPILAGSRQHLWMVRCAGAATSLAADDGPGVACSGGCQGQLQ